MRDGKFLEYLPSILKYITYNIEYIDSACACLWELGKDDNRELHQHPNHAIRILSELCTVEPNKPFEYIEAVVDFALCLLESEGSWESHYSPFDILTGILKTESHTTSSDGLSFSFHPFLVNKAFVFSLRNKVIDTTICLFTHPQTKLAILAAKFIHNALRSPHGEYGMQVPIETYDAWTEEFIQTLEKIEKSLQKAIPDNLVIIEIVRSISWHANYGRDKTKHIARRILSTLPNSIEFRTTLMLIDGYGLVFEDLDHEKQQLELERRMGDLIKELTSTYSSGEELRLFIEEIIAYIKANYKGEKNEYTYNILYEKLLEASPLLADAKVENSLSHENSVTRQFSGYALFTIFRQSHDR